KRKRRKKEKGRGGKEGRERGGNKEGEEEVTADREEKLDRISAGELNWKQVMRSSLVSSIWEKKSFQKSRSTCFQF
ncbi:hypothetical protein ACCS92_38605, partial [Rhizobium ruizarguesonis]